MTFYCCCCCTIRISPRVCGVTWRLSCVIFTPAVCLCKSSVGARRGFERSRSALTAHCLLVVLAGMTLSALPPYCVCVCETHAFTHTNYTQPPPPLCHHGTQDHQRDVTLISQLTLKQICCLFLLFVFFFPCVVSDESL